eukprot:RCo003276
MATPPPRSTPPHPSPHLFSRAVVSPRRAVDKSLSFIIFGRGLPDLCAKCLVAHVCALFCASALLLCAPGGHMSLTLCDALREGPGCVLALLVRHLWGLWGLCLSLTLRSLRGGFLFVSADTVSVWFSFSRCGFSLPSRQKK